MNEQEVGDPLRGGGAKSLEPGRLRGSGEAAREGAWDPASRSGAPTALPAGRGSMPRLTNKLALLPSSAWHACTARVVNGCGRRT